MDGTCKNDDDMDGVDYSQSGEASVAIEIFKALGIAKGHAIDIGAGDGRYLSNTRNLIELGWTAELYDGDPRGATDVQQVWLTLATVTSIAAARENPPDFLSIDVDGYDYWFLDGFLKYTKPVLVLCEYNPIHARDEAVTIPLGEGHRWSNDTWYGASLAAFELLAAKHGYTLIRAHAGINAFLLRNDHAEAHPELIRPIEYKVKRDHAPHPPEKEWQRL